MVLALSIILTFLEFLGMVSVTSVIISRMASSSVLIDGVTYGAAYIGFHFFLVLNVLFLLAIVIWCLNNDDSENEWVWIWVVGLSSVIGVSFIVCIVSVLVIVCLDRDSFSQSLGRSLEDNIKHYYDNQTTRYTIDTLQYDFQCCGIYDGYKDWIVRGLKIPISCCSSTSTNETCTEDNAFRTSCMSLFSWFHLGYAILIEVIIAAIFLMSIFFDNIIAYLLLADFVSNSNPTPSRVHYIGCGICLTAIGIPLAVLLSSSSILYTRIKASFSHIDSLSPHVYYTSFFIGLANLALWTLAVLLAFVGMPVKRVNIFKVGYDTIVLILRVSIWLLIVYAFTANLDFNSFQPVLEKELNDSLVNYGLGDRDSDNIIDTIQTNMKCCGIYSPTDWINHTAVPASCCPPEKVSLNTTCHLYKAYQTPCMYYFTDQKVAWSVIILTFTSIISVIILFIVTTYFKDRIPPNRPASISTTSFWNFLSCLTTCFGRQSQPDQLINGDGDNTSNQSVSTIAEDIRCKICFAAEINCALLECGHSVACMPCGERMRDRECPICRQVVSRVLRTYR